MRAALLAAGLGSRLKQDNPPPKILIKFLDATLLERHLAILDHCGIGQVDIVVGYRREMIAAEIARLKAEDWVTLHFNEQFQRGPIVSLATLAEAFTSGEDVIFMDGDVLYDHRMMETLVRTASGNCFLMDRQIEEGDDPVRLCMKDGALVDFHKRPRLQHDWWGEWIGFARFTPEIAAKIHGAATRRVEAGRLDDIYEEAMRDVLLSEPPGTFKVADVTGLPWVEIDFPDDLEKAKKEILPALQALPRPPRDADKRRSPRSLA